MSCTKFANKRIVQNGQSAAKLAREGSTTIPEGSRGKRPEVVGPATEAGEDIVYALWKHKERLKPLGGISDSD